MKKRPKLITYFFGPGKKTLAEKMEEALPVIVKLIPEVRKIYRGHTDPDINPGDGKLIGEMYDFVTNFDNTVAIGRNTWAGGPDLELEQDKRIAKTPKEVLSELETMPQPFTVENLDAKIALLKDKTSLTNQRYVSDQLNGMIKRLENRKSYQQEHAFYESFPNTTDEKIDALLRKYKLVIQNAELFIPSFPKEAIDVMKAYNDMTKKITGEKAIFYVIAEEKDFEEKRKKLDPILLAQSPFGFYWQILGAWDKEMVLLSEL